MKKTVRRLGRPPKFREEGTLAPTITLRLFQRQLKRIEELRAAKGRSADRADIIREVIDRGLP
jgi:hypothetical protein